MSSAVLLWPAVAVLGGAGALARVVADGAVSSWARRFPAGTLLVNASGAVVLGILVGSAVHGHAYLLAGTALIGSYTTFSTWMFESHRLAEDGRAWLGAANLAASIAVGLAAAELGRLLAGG